MIKYPLASTTWDQSEIDAIHSVINSGMYTMSTNVLQFEKEFANFVGSKFCVMVNSGSSANLLAVAALFFRKHNPLQMGDEVIVPAVSWSTTYYPLHQYGLKLKFVDIDEKTLNYDLKSLESAITPSTRMIVAVNLLGNPNDFTTIRRIIGNRNITLIEDNCESMGATFEGQQTGTFGEMGTFSSFFSHHISTMEGGMIVTQDEELYQILLSIRAHGWTRNLPKKNHICGELSDDPFFESFRFVLPGYNVRPLEMSGAIGIRQLEKLPQFIRERRENAKLFQELFGKHPYVTIQSEIGSSSWFGFALTLTNTAPFDRKTLAESLRNNGIECRPVVAGNFTRNPVIRWMKHEVHGSLKNADRIHDSALFVGNHQYTIKNELLLLSEVFKKISQT
jgi:CDP-6-deoxy-D-xylo-4-hexulose-3-dehydrase